jgi:hypothetical protein
MNQYQTAVTTEDKHIQREVKSRPCPKPRSPGFIRALTLAALCSIAFLTCSSAFAGSLPTYIITGTSVSQSGTSSLQTNLHFSSNGRLIPYYGTAFYLDPLNYLAVPNMVVTDTAITTFLISNSKNPVPSVPLEVQAIDLVGLKHLHVLGESAALRLATRALIDADLNPQFGTPTTSHSEFIVASHNIKAPKEDKVVMRNFLDTEVSYHFNLDGHPLVGPGAKVELNFNAAGKVTRLVYAARKYRKGPLVGIIPASRIRAKIANDYPGASKIALKLVYYSPPFAPPPNATAAWSPHTIIPYYEARITNRINKGKLMNHKIQWYPATDDATYVPTVVLNASSGGGSVVNAVATVTGGTPPYTFLWAGSNPSTGTMTGDSISYMSQAREYPAGVSGTTYPITDSVSVTVIDANGIEARANQNVDTQAQPMLIIIENDQQVFYGIESPNDPGPSSDPSYAPERIAWLQAMAAGGAGGTQGGVWLEDNCWPGDFIEPDPAGSLPSVPWVNGDADYSNWGINSSQMSLYNGDAGPDGWEAMYPGANRNDYNTGSGSSISRPQAHVSTVFVDGSNYDIDYTQSWGTLGGANDRLDWFCLYACQTLENLSTDDAPPWVRWGPAFNGLHSMLGFFTPASDNGIQFVQDFPRLMFGGSGQAPATIVTAWMNAALNDDMGQPAAMGPMYTPPNDGNIGVTDYYDVYWGQGPPNGPDITPQETTDFWYVTATD